MIGLYRKKKKVELDLRLEKSVQLAHTNNYNENKENIIFEGLRDR